MSTIIVMICLALGIVAFFIIVEALSWLYWKWRGKTALENNPNFFVLILAATLTITGVYIILGWDLTLPVTLIIGLGFVLLFDLLVRWSSKREAKRIVQGILAERDRKRQDQKAPSPIGSKISQGGGEK